MHQIWANTKDNLRLIGNHANPKKNQIIFFDVFLTNYSFFFIVMTVLFKPNI